jgi:pyridoxamine 5'-phosphate oxidase
MSSDPGAIATSLASLRKDYALKTLEEKDVDPDPIRQFGVWMVEAIHAQVPEPTAMSLATIDARHRPSNRICLLKGVDARGFVFYTNYQSRKARDIAANPVAALTFLWKELERQVRIEGTVEKVTEEESTAYFATRPLGSRIGAWASPQSERIENRAWLEQRWAELTKQYGEHPPRPPHWGGYRVLPDRIEYWQGRLSRLHDRIAYTRDALAWKVERLAPGRTAPPSTCGNSRRSASRAMRSSNRWRRCWPSTRRATSGSSDTVRSCGTRSSTSMCTASPPSMDTTGNSACGRASTVARRTNRAWC